MALRSRRASVPAPLGENTQETRPNGYYLRISEGYMRAKYILLVLLAVYLVFMLAKYRDDITYENMMYLLRDFSAGETEYSNVFEPVKYDEQDNMTYALFRGELAVAGNRTVAMYNSSGTLARRYETAFENPVLASSDKYLIAYDLGDTKYAVYNSITKVSGGDAPGTVEDADINDRGDHILVCRSDETKYVVYAYNSSFRNTAKYYKNKYVTCASVGRSAADVLICATELSGGSPSFEVEFYKSGDEAPAYTYSDSGTIPVRCGTWRDGSYYVLCTDRILFFSASGSLVRTVSAPTFGYSALSAGESTLALSADNDALGEKSSLFVFDTAGELLYNGVVDDSISSVSAFGGVLYALGNGSAYRVSYSGADAGSVYRIDVPEDSGVILADGVSAVICGKSTAFGFTVNDSDAEVTDENITSQKEQ